MKRDEDQITAVILNWKRPEGVQKICKQLNDIQLISEVLVWNNNPDLLVEPIGTKSRIINCSEDFGLFTRFSAASLAKNECILFHDDDIQAPLETLEFLYEKWKKKPYICHTAFGRNPKDGEYSMNTQYGSIEISLTRYVMVHRQVAIYALSKIPEFADIPGVPVGNGEDIILSYAAIDYSGKLNQAYELKTEDLFEEDEHAINTRYSDHITHRTKIIQRCKEVFRPKKRLILWNRIVHFFKKADFVLRREMTSFHKS